MATTYSNHTKIQKTVTRVAHTTCDICKRPQEEWEGQHGDCVERTTTLTHRSCGAAMGMHINDTHSYDVCPHCWHTTLKPFFAQFGSPGNYVDHNKEREEQLREILATRVRWGKVVEGYTYTQDMEFQHAESLHTHQPIPKGEEP